MSSSDSKLVEVAVTLVQHGTTLLAVFNQAWDAYTLPMTKRRTLPDPDNASQTHPESWQLCVQRSVGEWIDAPSDFIPEHVCNISGYRQSDRDLIVKDYHFEISSVHFRETPVVRASPATLWLQPKEFLELHRRPISPTARFLIQFLAENGKLCSPETSDS